MSDPRPRAMEAAEQALDRAGRGIDEAVSAVKPRLRGWLHAGIFPVAVLAGALLVVLSPTPQARVTTGVFALTAGLLFGVSAVYHRGHWSPRAMLRLKRLDHANIFLIIAGTYTPFAVLLLQGRGGEELLWIVWVGALAGVAFRVLWVGAPRWLYTPVYIALGWVALFYLPAIFEAGGPTVVALLATGGALYSAGGVVYAARRPNPSPRWFGFHEVFHALTLGGFVTHFAAVAIVVASVRT